MTDGHVPSSPHFFRPVIRSLLAALAALAFGAVWVRAPLQSAADPGHAPNPAKSAWFLLWIQELVSHGTGWVYVVLTLAVALVVLPWLRPPRAEQAAWFAPGERLLAAATAALVLAALVLTVVALWLRGEQWRLVLPS